MDICQDSSDIGSTEQEENGRLSGQVSSPTSSDIGSTQQDEDGHLSGQV